MYRILICDDDKDIVNALKIYLTAPDIEIHEAYNGLEALSLINQEDIQLILLDIMMPELDGISTIKKIRENSNIPILLLSAKSEDTDKILGLNTGADDYITKPFNPSEVIARVRSALRRYTTLGGKIINENEITIGGLTLNDIEKEVTSEGVKISLTPKEYEILKLLMNNPGKVFSPNEIYKEVWNEAPFDNGNIVAVHIRHIREKIEITPSEPRYLKVVWGQGYKIEKGRSI